MIRKKISESESRVRRIPLLVMKTANFFDCGRLPLLAVAGGIQRRVFFPIFETPRPAPATAAAPGVLFLDMIKRATPTRYTH